VVKDESLRNAGDVSPRHNMKVGYYKQNTVKITKRETMQKHDFKMTSY